MVAALLFLSNAACPVSTFRLSRRNRRSEEKLAERNSKLHAFAVELIRAEEDQRARIARELHDGVGQIMTAVNIELQMLHETAPNEMQARVEDVRALAAQCQIEMRRVSHELRPAILDELGPRRSGARARRAHGQARAHRDRVRRAGRGRSRPGRRSDRLLSSGAGGAQQRRASRRRQARARCRCTATRIGSTVTVTDDGRGIRYDPSSPETHARWTLRAHRHAGAHPRDRRHLQVRTAAG